MQKTNDLIICNKCGNIITVNNYIKNKITGECICGKCQEKMNITTEQLKETFKIESQILFIPQCRACGMLILKDEEYYRNYKDDYHLMNLCVSCYEAERDRWKFHVDGLFHLRNFTEEDRKEYEDYIIRLEKTKEEIYYNCYPEEKEKKEKEKKNKEEEDKEQGLQKIFYLIESEIAIAKINQNLIEDMSLQYDINNNVTFFIRYKKEILK